MQPAMNNSEKMGDKLNDAKWTAKTQLDRGLTELRGITEGDIKAVASDITHKVKEVSTDFFKDTVSLVKRYPVSSALGLTALGFLAGAITARSKK